MSAIEKVGEAVEAAEGGDEGNSADAAKSKLNTIVATSVAIAATFMALCNVKAGNVVQAMNKTQVDIVDTWSFFQAKSTKQSLAESALDQLTVQREVGSLEFAGPGFWRRRTCTWPATTCFQLTDIGSSTRAFSDQSDISS